MPTTYTMRFAKLKTSPMKSALQKTLHSIYASQWCCVEFHTYLRQSLPNVLGTPLSLSIISHKIIFLSISHDLNPLPPKNNFELKHLFVREVSAGILTVSVPVNTVYINIVLRGRGGHYYIITRNNVRVPRLLAEIVGVYLCFLYRSPLATWLVL